MSILSKVKHHAKKYLPTKYKLPITVFYHKINSTLDPEIKCIIDIKKNKRRFLDIGSNIGVYSYIFSKYYKNVDAFEPIKSETLSLKKSKIKNIKVHDLALSNENNQREIYFPSLNNEHIFSLSSIDNKNKYENKLLINTKKLDDFKFDDVDFIKIDVEGHEQNVIEGGLETIKKNKPLLLIEIEQRHLQDNIQDVFNKIINLGYKGYFLKKNKINCLKNFDYQIDQKQFLEQEFISGLNFNYIKNFIFLSDDQYWS